METIKIDIEKSSLGNLINIELIILGNRYGGILYREKDVNNDKLETSP